MVCQGSPQPYIKRQTQARCLCTSDSMQAPFMSYFLQSIQMTDFSYLEPFPLEIRKLLIRIKEVASVCADPRYLTALIHQRQKLINRLTEFVEADKRAAEATATVLEEAPTITPRAA